MAQQTANQSGLLNQQMAQSQQQMQHAQTQAQYEQLKMQVELQRAQLQDDMQRAQQTCNHEMVTYCEPVEGRAVEPFCLHCRRTKKELVIKELKRVKS